jgi:hypothetical protein
LDEKIRLDVESSVSFMSCKKSLETPALVTFFVGDGNDPMMMTKSPQGN